MEELSNSVCFQFGLLWLGDKKAEKKAANNTMESGLIQPRH